MASIIERYLAELRSELRMSSGRKARILTEITGHLYDALNRAWARGISGEEAEHYVIQRFGPVRELAGQFLADQAEAGIRRASRALLLSEGFLIVFSFLRARTQPPGPWPHDILPAHLAPMVNSATFAFLLAMLGSVFAAWRIWRQRKKSALSEREMKLILIVAVCSFIALLSDGICYSIFTFQRAAEVAHSPSPLWIALLAAIELCTILVGGVFVARAATHYAALSRVAGV